jgi:hypothetical protein
MMNRGIVGTCLLTLVLALCGCSTFLVTKADRAKAPKGVRLYEPRVCLFVDQGEKKSTLAYLPDYTRGYDVKPLTILAKQDFKIEAEEAQLKSLTSNQDTTAFLSFLKEAAAMAAKAAAGGGVSSQVLNGTFGFSSGVHCMNDVGTFE